MGSRLQDGVQNDNKGEVSRVVATCFTASTNEIAFFGGYNFENDRQAETASPVPIKWTKSSECFRGGEGSLGGF